MAANAEVKMHQNAGKQVIEAARRSLEAHELARKHIARATELTTEVFHFLDENWDEQYEHQLRETGFRGSLFILRDFRLHFEAIGSALETQTVLQRSMVKQLESGVPPTGQFNPLVDSTTRGLCRALIRFLDFEDQMAQTQMVRLSLEEAVKAKG